VLRLSKPAALNSYANRQNNHSLLLTTDSIYADYGNQVSKLTGGLCEFLVGDRDETHASGARMNIPNEISVCVCVL